MSKNNMPVMVKELIEFRNSIRIGDKVVVERPDEVFERKKIYKTQY